MLYALVRRRGRPAYSSEATFGTQSHDLMKTPDHVILRLLVLFGGGEIILGASNHVIVVVSGRRLPLPAARRVALRGLVLLLQLDEGQPGSRVHLMKTPDHVILRLLVLFGRGEIILGASNHVIVVVSGRRLPLPAALRVALRGLVLLLELNEGQPGSLLVLFRRGEIILGAP